jgi:ABC-type lipoprotein export system ATPase subunit
MLEVRQVVKEYRPVAGESVRAVDEVSLSVGAGELVALYGPSGSGKTTLLELIAGVQRPDQGAVLVDGQEVATLDQRELDHYRLSTLGIVPQSLRLVDGPTALDLAALRLTEQGLSWKAAHQRAMPLLERLGLRARADHQAGELSKGERQRVAITMALSTQPLLVLADEPTGNLDTRRGQDVLSLLAEYSAERGAAVLLVTHDPQATHYAHRTLALQDGRLDASKAAPADPVPGPAS